MALGVTFLDDVIDQSHYPLPQITAISRPTARSAWGSWAWRICSSSWGSAYDSPEALKLAETIMARIQDRAVAQSQVLAEQRGPFPNFPHSRWHHEGRPPRRNATVTTVAPTGTISLIAGASSGIEPLFAVAYRRRALEGEEFEEIHPLFLEKLREAGLKEAEWLPRVLAAGRVRPLTGLPEELSGFSPPPSK